MVLWKGPLILDSKGNRLDKAFGNFGRIATLSDLPSKKTLVGYLTKAVKLNEEGVKVSVRKNPPKPKTVEVPEDLAKLLKKNSKARGTFEAFSSSHKRAYTEWITGAKRDETRQKRLVTSIEWLEHGKTQMWKYEKR